MRDGRHAGAPCGSCHGARSTLFSIAPYRCVLLTTPTPEPMLSAVWPGKAPHDRPEVAYTCQGNCLSLRNRPSLRALIAQPAVIASSHRATGRHCGATGGGTQPTWLVRNRLGARNPC
jgi:hypothetical protein